MKAETVMDLFQFIKAARVQRAGLVTNKVRIASVIKLILHPCIQDQYEFGHQVVADFLDGFDTYANFKEII